MGADRGVNPHRHPTDPPHTPHRAPQRPPQGPNPPPAHPHTQGNQQCCTRLARHPDLHVRTTYQRTWHPESVRCVSSKLGSVDFKRLHQINSCCFRTQCPSRVLGGATMATRVPVPNHSFTDRLYIGWRRHGASRCIDHELSLDQGRDAKSRGSTER